MPKRHYNALDRFIIQADKALQTVFGQPKTTERPNPSSHITEEDTLSNKQRQQAARLMRVNHAGEVAAQALYQGQALTAKNTQLAKELQQCADEENDHLLWCEQRIKELNSHNSYLNPVWYMGSLAIGITAGMVGDKWSLGFLEETEKQVVEHLEKHLKQLPKDDIKSRRIVTQMQTDEAEHADKARKAGAANLPIPIKFGMKITSKIMTSTAYYL